MRDAGSPRTGPDEVATAYEAGWRDGVRCARDGTRILLALVILLAAVVAGMIALAPAPQQLPTRTGRDARP